MESANKTIDESKDKQRETDTLPPAPASLVGNQIKLPNLSGITTWNVVQMYVVYTYVFSLVNGVKDYLRESSTAQNSTDTHNRLLHDKIMKLVNALQPISLLTKCFGEDHKINIFDHNQRFLKSDDNWFVLCPVLQRLIWIPEHPCILLEDLIEQNNNKDVTRIYNQIIQIASSTLPDLKENKKRLSKTYDKRTKVEVPLVLVVLANAPKWEKYSFFRKDLHVQNIRKSARQVDNHDIEQLIRSLYAHAMEVVNDASLSSLQFRMFLDYLTTREEIFFQVSADDDASAYGMNETTFFRSFQNNNFNI